MAWPFKRDGVLAKVASRLKIDGTVVESTLADAEELFMALDGPASSANFVHVTFADEHCEKNLIEFSRKNREARHVVVELAARQYYLYKNDAGRSSFVSRRRLTTLWAPIKNGKFTDTGDVIYGIEPALAPASRPKLLVVFPAMAAPIYQSSLFRYATRNYNTIQKFVSPSTHVMRLVDLGGVVGNFYLDTTVLPDNTAKIQAAIRQVMADLQVRQEDVVLLGSSKGATGAVFHGLTMGIKHVAVDPVLSEVEYWDRLDDSHFTKNRIFNKTKQQVFASLQADLVAQGMWADRLAQQVLITSRRSPQYQHTAPLLVEDQDTNEVFINDNPGITDHPDVPKFSLHVATSTVDQLLAGVPITPGHFLID